MRVRKREGKEKRIKRKENNRWKKGKRKIVRKKMERIKERKTIM